ncbi:MAG: hypothetical protein FJ387_14120 [Verrucomicrobia bacterium]|nr:hypothetical protein [Verrucomicrobiota bacterium]
MLRQTLLSESERKEPTINRIALLVLLAAMSHVAVTAAENPNLAPQAEITASAADDAAAKVADGLVPAAAQPAKPGILAVDFQSDPAKAGWELLQFSGIQTPAKGGWVPGSRTRESSDSKSGDFGYVSVENGYWQSSPFGVTPHQYYRLTFQSHAQVPGYWAAMFFAADGQMLPADHNSGIFQTDDWIDNELYFQAKADAASARLWFFPASPKDGHTICIRNVTLATATDQQVLDWADRLYATLPPVQYQPPRDRWTLIPRTIEKLRRGEPLRIVILGDSIGNDTGSSPLDKLIQRQYPGSRVTVITSIRGGARRVPSPAQVVERVPGGAAARRDVVHARRDARQRPRRPGRRTHAGEVLRACRSVSRRR